MMAILVSASATGAMSATASITPASARATASVGSACCLYSRKIEDCIFEAVELAIGTKARWVRAAGAVFAEEGFYNVEGARVGDEAKSREAVDPGLVLVVAERWGFCKDREAGAGHLSAACARYQDCYGFDVDCGGGVRRSEYCRCESLGDIVVSLCDPSVRGTSCSLYRGSDYAGYFSNVLRIVA